MKEEAYSKDIQAIREELESYFGTAACSGFDMAACDLHVLEEMNEEELRQLHEQLGL